MVLDTSAIVALIANKPERAVFQNAMLEALSLAMSAVSVLETQIVLYARHGAEAVRVFDQMLARANIVVAPFDEAMARVAFDAFGSYGKGQGHPAQLNIVDCAACPLARVRGEPLLFKGGDFGKTDIVAAL